MLALKIIGIIVLIFLLISLIRVGAVIEFGGELTVSLAIGPLRVKILPAKEKKEKKKKPPKKKKEKTQKPKEAAPKKKRKITLKQVKELLGILWPAIKKTLRRVGRGIRISPLRLSVIVGGDDPSKVAETYGWLSQAVWGAMPQLEKLTLRRLPITDISWISGNTALEELEITKTGITRRWAEKPAAADRSDHR